MNEVQEIRTIGDALYAGGSVALQGMAIVFGVLILLMLILMLMKVVFYKDTSKQKKMEVPVHSVPEKEEEKQEIDDEELIAVLTAAVAASLNTSTYNLKIKSYRRVGNSASAWNRAGLEETVNHY